MPTTVRRTAPPSNAAASTTTPATATGPAWHNHPASPAQIKYINSLASARELTDSQRDWLTTELETGQPTKRRAGAIIDKLKALPEAVKPAAVVQDIVTPKVAAGHYALRFPDDAVNPIRFYVVQDGKNRWEGRQFVKRYASDETYPVRGVEMRNVLVAIAADPLTAATLYGTQIKRCSICNRKLTRQLSRAMGMGAKCAGRSDFVTDAVIADAISALEAQGIDPNAVVEETC